MPHGFYATFSDIDFYPVAAGLLRYIEGRIGAAVESVIPFARAQFCYAKTRGDPDLRACTRQRLVAYRLAKTIGKQSRPGQFRVRHQ